MVVAKCNKTHKAGCSLDVSNHTFSVYLSVSCARQIIPSPSANSNSYYIHIPSFCTQVVDVTAFSAQLFESRYTKLLLQANCNTATCLCVTCIVYILQRYYTYSSMYCSFTSARNSMARRIHQTIRKTCVWLVPKIL